MNAEIRNLQETIINAINEATLPIEVKRLVLANVYMIVEKEANNVIRQESEMKETDCDNE